jgi:hypothetical protein
MVFVVPASLLDSIPIDHVYDRSLQGSALFDIDWEDVPKHQQAARWEAFRFVPRRRLPALLTGQETLQRMAAKTGTYARRYPSRAKAEVGIASDATSHPNTTQRHHRQSLAMPERQHRCVRLPPGPIPSRCE